MTPEPPGPYAPISQSCVTLLGSMASRSVNKVILIGRLGKDAQISAFLDVFNLFDRKVNDIEYYYQSQLPTETAAVADKHVHAAEPRSVRVTLKWNF